MSQIDPELRAQLVAGCTFHSEPDPDDDRYRLLTIRTPLPPGLSAHHVEHRQDQGQVAAYSHLIHALNTLGGSGLLPKKWASMMSKGLLAARVEEENRC